MIGLSGVTFRYASAAEPCLRDVDATVDRGKVVVLAGPSGCGKTTITRLVGGLIPEFFAGDLTGTVRVDDLVPPAEPMWRTATVVGVVFQNPRTQFFTTDTESELAFGCENLGVPADLTRERVARALQAYGLEALAGRSVFALSGGEKQRLACAAVATAQPPVIVLDEPSANLDDAATDDLRHSIGEWVARGTTVLVAEHRLSYLVDLADEVLVLDDGWVIHRLAGAEFRTMDTAQLAAIGLRATRPPEPVLPGPAPEADAGLVVRDLRHRVRPRTVPGALPGPRRETLHVDRLACRAGEVTAFVGPNGAGKSTLLECLAGLRPSTGDVVVDGRTLAPRRRGEQVYLVMQDVSHQLFTDSVTDEVELALPRGSSDVDMAGLLARLDLADVADRHPLSLSGGQQQRLAIACALASGRPVLAFDEPTSGLDLAHMRQVAAALTELAAAGRTVLVATHDRELLHAVADRVVRLDRGAIVG